MEHDDLERAGRRFLQSLLRVGQLRRADPARLVPPRANRVEADDVQSGRGVGRLGRLPLPLELPKRVGEPTREGVRDVVIARNRQHGPVEAVEKTRGAGELVLPSPVGQVAARDDQFRLEALDQSRCPTLDRIVVTRSVMEVREV